MSKPKLKIIFSFLILIFFSLSCDNKLKGGIVTEKWYEAGKDEIYVEYSLVLEIPITKHRWKEESYVLMVKGLEEKSTFNRRLEVSSKFFQKTNIGDTISLK